MDLGAALVLGVHIVGAALWVGGTFFLAIVTAAFPGAAERSPQDEERLAAVARRAAWVLWPALLVTVLTGLVNFYVVYSPDLSGWFGTPSGPFLAAKLVAVAVMVGSAAAHSFGFGPRIRRRRAEGASPGELRRLRAINGALGAVTGVSSLLVLMLAAIVGSY